MSATTFLWRNMKNGNLDISLMWRYDVLYLWIQYIIEILGPWFKYEKHFLLLFYFIVLEFRIIDGETSVSNIFRFHFTSLIHRFGFDIWAHYSDCQPDCNYMYSENRRMNLTFYDHDRIQRGGGQGVRTHPVKSQRYMVS